MTGRRVLVLGISTLSALSLLVPPASATGHWSRLGLSVHGSVWSQHLDKPLFEPSLRLAPGTAAVRSFLVRNQASQRGYVSVVVHVRDPHGWLARNGLGLAVRGDGTWREVGHTGATRVPLGALGPARVQRVQVRAQMPRSAGNATTGSVLPFDLTVRLSQVPQG